MRSPMRAAAHMRDLPSTCYRTFEFYSALTADGSMRVVAAATARASDPMRASERGSGSSAERGGPSAAPILPNIEPHPRPAAASLVG